MQCHYRLKFDSDKVPKFYVFNTCKNFIRTIPALLYSDSNVEDVNTKLEDHIYDDWRYMCMDRPISAKSIEETKENLIEPSDPLNQNVPRMEHYAYKNII